MIVYNLLMGALITIIGNCGSGKTTLARLICCQLGYYHLLEQHAERPFQAAFMHDQDRRRQVLPNQVEYLLLRAEQDRSIILNLKSAIKNPQTSIPGGSYA